MTDEQTIRKLRSALDEIATLYEGFESSNKGSYEARQFLYDGRNIAREALRPEIGPEITSATQITDHGITVNVGEDGTWVFFKTKSGRSFGFQPIQQWPINSTFGQTISDWCREMQAHRSDETSPVSGDRA